MNELRKGIEPFNLFGERSLIFNREEAAKILKENSYYIFASSLILMAVFLLLLFLQREIFLSKTAIFVLAIYYLILGATIRFLKSRIAAILSLVSYGLVFASRVLASDIDGTFVFSLLFLAASYRCVRAAFFYQKRDSL